MQSHSTFPAEPRTSSARCPIANGGSVPIPVTPGPSSPTRLQCADDWSSSRLVHCRPFQPTYCRSSRHTGQSGRSAAYCTPHVRQMGYKLASLTVTTSFTTQTVLTLQESRAGPGTLPRTGPTFRCGSLSISSRPLQRC